MAIIVQQDATEYSFFLCLWFRASLIYINNCPTRCNTKQSICYSASSLYMFRVSTTPIIRNTQNCNYNLLYCTATSLQRGHVNLATLEGDSCIKIWPVSEAVVTVLCTPDDRCSWHPKHVEWTCRIINRLLCVASRWTIFNIYCPCLLELGSKFLDTRIKCRPYSRHTECTVPSKLPSLWLVQFACLLEKGGRKAKCESFVFSEPTLNFAWNVTMTSTAHQIMQYILMIFPPDDA